MKDSVSGVLWSFCSTLPRGVVASLGASETAVLSPTVTKPQQPPDVFLNPDFLF